MNMERLTEENQIGPFASLKDKAESVPGAFNTYDCFYAHAIAVTRFKTAAIVHSSYDDIDLPLRDFGKTVFRTREEAEAASGRRNCDETTKT